MATATAPKPRSLTQALLGADPAAFARATQSSFLIAAGQGRVSKKLLSKWLSQDRLYAQTYVSFIGALISRIELPINFIQDKSTSLRWRIVSLLSKCLTNINRELDFFTDVAKRYDLNLEEFSESEDDKFHAGQAAAQYIDLFNAFVQDPSMSLMEGLLVLWATEYCYFSAWSFAGSQTPTQANRGNESSNDQDGGALRKEFIPNWTSDEFQQFVDEIAELADQLAERERAWRKIEVYKAVWLHVLQIETDFWPAYP